MSYVTSYYHAVFATYRREAVLGKESRNTLYQVIKAIIRKKECEPLIVGGVENHVHILFNLNPNQRLADVMRDVKSQSSHWASRCGYFPLFRGWAHEYGAFSLSASHRQPVYEYIQIQEAHHAKEHLEEEFKRLVIRNGLQFYPW